MISHILKDGKEVKSISGKMLGMNDFSALYQIVSAIRERKNNGSKEQSSS